MKINKRRVFMLIAAICGVILLYPIGLVMPVQLQYMRPWERVPFPNYIQVAMVMTNAAMPIGLVFGVLVALKELWGVVLGWLRGE